MQNERSELCCSFVSALELCQERSKLRLTDQLYWHDVCVEWVTAQVPTSAQLGQHIRGEISRIKAARERHAKTVAEVRSCMVVLR